MLSSTSAATGTSTHRPAALEHLDPHGVAGPDAEHLAEHLRQHQALGRQRHDAAVPIDDAVQRRLGHQAGDRQRRGARCPTRSRAGTARIGSTAITPGSRCTACSASAERGSHEGHASRPAASARTNCSSISTVHHVDEDEADQQDRAGERDAEHRGRRAQRLALEVAQDHARGARQAPEHAPAFADALPVRAGASGRIASAGGTRTARRTADCAPSAATARLPAMAPIADARRQPVVAASGSGSTGCRARSSREPSHAPSHDAGHGAERGDRRAPTSRSATPARRSRSRAP